MGAGTRFLAAQRALTDNDSEWGLRRPLPGLALALSPAGFEDALVTGGTNEWLQDRKSIRSAYQARMTASKPPPPNAILIYIHPLHA